MEENKTHKIRDIGFGKVASQLDVPRLLNADGSFSVEKQGLSWWEQISLYHWFVTMSWPRFFLVITFIYVVSNIFFATVYWLGGANTLSGMNDLSAVERWLRCFFFSVQTMSTVGYGSISPNSLFANLIVLVEVIFGLFEVALVTGLIFARFSKPIPKIKFSEQALIAPFQGYQSFQFRMLNLRRSELIEPRVKVLFSYLEKNGERMDRRYERLKLYLDRIIFFPLYWTVSHIIDEQSPLWGLDQKRLEEIHAEFLILLNATDESFSDQVQLRRSYRYDEIVFDARFDSMYIDIDSGQPSIDVAKLSSYSPVPS